MDANQRKYKAVLISFMRYRDGIDCDKDFNFTQQQLSEVTAQDVVNWFNFCACGRVHPMPEDRPTSCRSDSLLHWKKALSCFMPNRNHQWNELTNAGNPTQSQAVNDVTLKVKKFEARKQGAPSKARRPLKDAEFRAVLGALRGTDDVTAKHAMPALMVFQFHLIGRLDDCCKWMCINLKPHDAYPDKAFKAKLCWGKNVHEERDAPWQHVFGCMDWTFCCILHIGLWLEVFCSTVHGSRQRPFVFGLSDEMIDEEKAARRSKAKVYSILTGVLGETSADIVDDDGDDEDKLGTHSVRKCASTWTRRNGVAQDDKDHRGRWKQKRVSDQCDDIELDCIDAKVAQVLCPSGVCNHIRLDDACTNAWLCTNVTPSIHEVFGETIGALFGRALLWLACSEHREFMPHEMLLRITTACESIRTIDDNRNPIEKRLVCVSGEEGTVCMEDAESEQPGTNMPAGNVANPLPSGGQQIGHGNGVRQLLLQIASNQNAMRRAIADNSNGLEGIRGILRQQNRTLRSPSQRIDNNSLVAPHRNRNRNQQQQPNANPTEKTHQMDTNCNPNASLHPSIRTLHQLWQEHIQGIGGNKPARFFTRAERGRCKSKYSRRKIAWDVIAHLVRSGLTASQAISRIEIAYPGLSVTNIINCLRRDKNNLPESLQIV